tara:strand:- start:9115 stop:10287 length:1173 start_codon:yes stop_codon:yes gene_type:complete
LHLLALIPALLLASACVSKQVKRVNEVQAQQAKTELPTEQVLSVVVTQFDPGIPETIKEQQKERIYPEVRKAEANFIPQVLRSTLDNTGYWGTVRVLPKATASTMIEVGGKILHSDGETLRVRVYATDATGRKWLDKEYEEVAAELSYTEKTISALDPFQDLYNNIANDLLAQRNKLTAEQMLELKRVSKLKFAADLAPARFEGYLQSDSSGRLSIKRLPPESDPIVQRIEDVRLRDDLLVDTLDAHYSAFQQNMRPAYQEWRRANYSEVIALRELEQQALGRKIAGAAAVVGGVYAVATAESAGTAAAGSVGIIGGVGLITSGLHKGKEAELHAESLRELNSSISDDVAPRVVKLDEKTITLSGSAEEQYAQWRQLLQQRYAAETGATP